jgi:hypothetical protein
MPVPAANPAARPFSTGRRPMRREIVRIDSGGMAGAPALSKTSPESDSGEQAGPEHQSEPARREAPWFVHRACSCRVPKERGDYVARGGGTTLPRGRKHLRHAESTRSSN